MFEINIDPTMLQLGPLSLTWHGFFTAVGLFLGVWVAARLAPSVGISADDIYGAAPWGVLGGVIGARAFHVIDQWSYYSQDPIRILYIQEGGIAVFGAVIGGILAGYLYGLRKRMPIARFADASAVGLIFGQGIGRIGDVINGEHHGKVLDAPWAVVYSNPRTLGDPGLPVHLAVGYEMVLDLAVFGLLIWLWKKVPAGFLFWLYFVLYGAIRLGIGFYRIDTQVAIGLGQAQLVGLASIVVAGPLAFWTYQRRASIPAAESVETEVAQAAAPEAAPNAEPPGNPPSEDTKD